MTLNEPNNLASTAIIENEAFWRHHIALLTASKLTRKEYCRLNNINYDRFGYWLGKFSNQSSSLVAVKLKPTSEIKPVNALCTLHFVSGHTLHIHDQQALAFLWEKLN